MQPGLPFTIDSYTFTATGLKVAGRPTLDEHEAVGTFIRAAVAYSPWWLADWLRYGEARQDWQERLQQALDSTTLSESRLKAIRATGAIDPDRRRTLVPFDHHTEVAALPADEQDQLLDAAESEGWTRAELRQEIRALRRRKVLDGHATLSGMYRVIYADPPWAYQDRGATADGSLQKAERHYPVMSIEELCKLPVGAHALPDAVLFLWIPAPQLLLNPGPRDVIEAWGFGYKTGGVWDKVLGTWGHYLHICHEHVAICTRGSCLPDRPTPQPGSVYHERRSNVHSQKPAGIRTRWIEQLYTRGPFLELFARERIPGWDAFGNDPRLWHEEVVA
jgi:N6-adenosine-specific RNA methylase IME4